MAEMVAARMLSPGVAGLLLALIERRMPVTVVSRDAGAGKTALLTALLSELPPSVSPVALRGSYEPFDFVGDPRRLPSETAVLINEISPHWPFYLWGPAVARALRLSRRGYAVYATAHAGSAAGLVDLLSAYPLSVPLADIAALSTVVVLDARPAKSEPSSLQRRITSCHGLTMASSSQAVELIALAGSEHADVPARLHVERLTAWWAWVRPDDPGLDQAAAAHAIALSRGVAQRSATGCGRE